MTNNQLTEAELTDTLDAVTSGYPLTASAEANLRRVFAELQERRKPLLDKDLHGVLGALEHPAGINAAGKQVVRLALLELQERRKDERGSEPVAWTDERNLGYIDRGRETAYLWGKQNSEASDVALYRHAQPAPVVPEDVLDALQKVARIRLDLNGFDGDRRGIADCLGNAEEALIEVVNRRAAMLAAAPQEVKPWSSHYLPVTRGDAVGCPFNREEEP